ncbi:alpha/beta hydrolase [Streptomyces sp. NPDC058464]|uniref:alpha/beta hydrolase n=1 Tax=Streptomyces sp. NPDC058464 TaxID=3346511 RepID=UPI00365BE194
MTGRQELRIPVPSPRGDLWHTAAWLTVPDPVRRSELQILLHGATYDHRYWDWPLEPQTYSYVRFATEYGSATLAVDRIGSGFSTRPPGRDNTVRAQARALSHLVRAARTGALGGQAFSRVVLVGHSLGSVLAAAEAAWYTDVDAVVLTGLMGIGTTAEDDDPRADLGFTPAVHDPVTGHLTGLVDDAYLTVRTDLRVPMFYVQDNVHPDVLSLDERIKGVITRGEVSDMGTAAAAAREVRAPALVLIGEHDAMEIDPATDSSGYAAVERLAPQAPGNFEFTVLPGVGHNINLHRSAPDAYRLIADWLDATAERAAGNTGDRRHV